MKYAFSILLSLVVTTTTFIIVPENYTNKCDIKGKSTVELKVQFSQSDAGIVNDFKFLLTNQDIDLKFLVSCTSVSDSEISNSYPYICSFWTHDEDYDITYTVEHFGDYSLDIDETIYINVSPCNGLDILKNKANGFLSFRQVRKFVADKNSFDFYGVTTSPINDAFSFLFKIYIYYELYGGISNKIVQDAKCIVKKSVSVPESGIASVCFNCQYEFEKPNPDERFEHLIIMGSDTVVGFPSPFEKLDQNYYNPRLVDYNFQFGIGIKIDENSLTPKFIKDAIFTKFNDDGFDSFKISGNLDSTMSEHQPNSFTLDEFYLVYPKGTSLQCSFSYDNSLSVTFICKSNTKIESETIIFDQRILVNEGNGIYIAIPGKIIDTTEPADEEEEEKNDGIEEMKEEKEETKYFNEEKNEEFLDNIPEETFNNEENESINESKEEEEEEKVDEAKESEKSCDETSEKEETEIDTNDSDGKNATSTEESVTDQASASTDKTISPTDESKQTELPEEEGTITLEEAEKRAEIKLTFEQLKGFSFKQGEDITFNFLALTSEDLTKGLEIKLLVYLIKNKEGTEEEAKEATCTLKNDVSVPKDNAALADFRCSISKTVLKQNMEYRSLKLYSSEYVTGIPIEDETALNPLLTNEAIEKGEMIDVSKNGVPPTFKCASINQESCEKDGKFTLVGSFTKTPSIITEFTIPLTYPEGMTLKCSQDGSNLECITDRNFDDKNIVIEQTMVKTNDEYLFILSSITNQKLKCGNGLLKEAQEKEKVNISFRQVSKLNPTEEGFTFFFAAFVKEKLPANYEIKMKMIVMLNKDTKEKIEKNATCVLREAVEPSGSPIQGDFDCKVVLEASEKEKVDLNDKESIYVSTNNKKIGGCAELSKEEVSPKATDEAIKNSKNAKSDLSVVIDYSIAENKNNIPQSFEIEEFNIDTCYNRGKIKIKGIFNGKLTKKIDFTLPFTFPSSEIKCSIENETQTEITCKARKGFKGVESFIIEPRLLKKKKREILFVKKKENVLFNFDNLKCRNYNEILLEKAIQAKKADFNFLQIGRPSNFSQLFFIALAKKNKAAKFEKKIFNFYLRYEKSSRIRLLDEAEVDLNISCNPEIELDDMSSLNCDSSLNGEPLKVELPSKDISSPTEEIPIEKNPNPDLSTLEGLKNISSLPIVNINDINYYTCSQTGEYVLSCSYAENSEKFKEKKYDNITIPFSNPDSKGLCELEAGTDIKIICQNTEAFSVSEVIIPSQIIKEKDDTTPLFKINEDITKQFSCIISDLSEKNTTITDNSAEQGSSGNRFFRNGSSGGLSGGAIAAIVIASVVAVAVVTVLISLIKKGSLFGANKSAIEANIENNSTFNRFALDPKKN